MSIFRLEFDSYKTALLKKDATEFILDLQLLSAGVWFINFQARMKTFQVVVQVWHIAPCSVFFAAAKAFRKLFAVGPFEILPDLWNCTLFFSTLRIRYKILFRVCTGAIAVRLVSTWRTNWGGHPTFTLNSKQYWSKYLCIINTLNIHFCKKRSISIWFYTRHRTKKTR